MLVFFFKQKTAYEMRISDWSSDVCSSDLLPPIKSVGMPDRRHGREEQHVSVKRALVIGSSGGIGAALVNQLVASGRFDRIYARNRRPHAAHHSNVTRLTIEILDDDTLAEAGRKIDRKSTRLNQSLIR